MKKVRLFVSLSIAVSMLIMFYSCGPGEEKKADETAAVDTVAAKPAEAAPVVPAKPANVLIVWHKVANYAKFLPSYEAHDSLRLANGLHNYIIGRGVKDPNMVLVAVRMDDAEKAKKFGASAELKDAMKKSGVIGAPTVSYVDVQVLDTTANATTRVMVTSKVKDWDAWKKEFDAHKPARLAAGLTDRAVGYSVGDNHNVTLVFAVSDMKKAEEFFKSKDLKDKMDAAGVEGPPSIMYYTVAKKY